MAVVVVFPFVAETTATPVGSRAASASRAPGSTFQSSFPGSVVPPPRPTARERRPTSRAAEVSALRRYPHADEPTPRRWHAAWSRPFWPSCKSHRMLYSDCIWPGPGVATLHSPGSTRQHSQSFAQGIRRRYTDEQILEQLRASAERLGRSPTMREFAADKEAGMHPQTVIEHFGTWNAAKRAAGLTPRRFISRDELLEQLRQLGDELGRTADGSRPRCKPASRWRRSR